MILKITKNADANYLAVVITLPEIKPHPNADRLSIVEVFGNTIILAKDMYVQGEKVVYFPVESCLKPSFLSWANLLDNPDFNADSTIKGFFTSSGRVKAVRLRQIPSQGFVFKTEKLAKYYNCEDRDFTVGTSFDSIDDDVLVTKYIRSTSTSGQPNVKSVKIPPWVNNVVGRLPRYIRKIVYKPIKWYYSVNPDEGIKRQILDGQFKFHYSTEHLGKNIFVLSPDDNITITSKWHGTSAIFANILCRVDIPWYKKLLYPVERTKYKLIYSSRKVIKGVMPNPKYSDNVWGDHAKLLDGKLPEGVTIFSEIVGWVRSGKAVQKNYTYGVIPGTSAMRVYRICRVDKLGQWYEFNWAEIEAFCHMYGFKTVPVYYQGLARDLFPLLIVNDNWGANFLTAMKDKYLDKPCEFCGTGIVNEGIVLKINNRESKPAFKFKSPKFVEDESKARDTGEENIDEEN